MCSEIAGFRPISRGGPGWPARPFRSNIDGFWASDGPEGGHPGPPSLRAVSLSEESTALGPKAQDLATCQRLKTGPEPRAAGLAGVAPPPLGVTLATRSGALGGRHPRPAAHCLLSRLSGGQEEWSPRVRRASSEVGRTAGHHFRPIAGNGTGTRLKAALLAERGKRG